MVNREKDICKCGKLKCNGSKKCYKCCRLNKYLGVGRSFANSRRYKTDPRFRERNRQIAIKYHKKVEVKEKNRIRELDLSLYRNKYCGLCSRLLHYFTKRNICYGCLLSNFGELVGVKNRLIEKEVKNGN